MQVTFVIPVYNAELYVREAVESIVHEPEVVEILLIEDGSSDGSLTVCKDLAQEYGCVRVLTHADGKNRGAGASRNLGIKCARTTWISFLDADDVSAPNRFVSTAEALARNPECEAIYEPVGLLGRHKWEDRVPDGPGRQGLTTPEAQIEPQHLFDRMAPIGLGGGISTNGVTVKRTALAAVDMFDECLRVSQDTHMWLRLAARERFVGAPSRRIVALRRIHSGNRGRIRANHRRYRSTMFGKLAFGSQGYFLTEKRKAFVLALCLIHSVLTLRHRRLNPETRIWRTIGTKRRLQAVARILRNLPYITQTLLARKFDL